ncbi:hypothetical protein CGMCC3_g14572 [Colletotrichum fructicola]|uniref:Uncharacterized protein n=1 Tax=Colletotrichum fructicola (strain Nara gc5) TaxID=1213859 RepID=A0A7J6JHP0_COLFN|nr:uncharacterized protein CGMCC3_g14572 [Colletotrichum fructicola]KAE9569285.1 hypothetical protein CGMCC3_g14572 [Colletotrichum fructicola]KAF4489838.1 hypothetical protein CGGC5_v004471 [Colletotrichum fructicola Nara gc5]KAF4883550.1 hypothetical protein CGCFRS4_v013467 [Colletotrichum fructicola]
MLRTWLCFHLLITTIYARDVKFTEASNADRIIATNSTRAPYHIPPATWGRLMSPPNATGHFPFQGPNLSAPYPSNASTHTTPLTWAVSLDIKADISLAHTESPRLFNTSTYVSGGVLSLTPPEALIAPALHNGTAYRHHRTWKVCAFSIAPPIPWTPDTQREMHDAGDCQASEFMDRFAKPAFANDAACPVITMLDGPCAMSSWVQGYEIALDRETHAMFAPWGDGQAVPDEMIPYVNGAAVFQWASDWGEKGNLTAYHQDTGFFWPMFVAFGFNETWMAREANASKLVSFVYARAQTAAAGSEIPESGGVVGGRVSWGVLGLLGMFAVWLL